jgi:hypothetical protein
MVNVNPGAKKGNCINFLFFSPFSSDQDATCSCHIEIFDLFNSRETSVENFAFCDAHRIKKALHKNDQVNLRKFEKFQVEWR